ncbi:hypothetical protein, partial [Bacillus sp. AFS017336]|uniref:hypothetical protein n=1 Tax=Bacillus sp. AFS017336 TaxID=2033489 RepID=UPI0015CF7850
MKKGFTSLIVLVLIFSMFKDVFAESTTQAKTEKWVVTLGPTVLTIQNTETGGTAGGTTGGTTGGATGGTTSGTTDGTTGGTTGGTTDGTTGGTTGGTTSGT